MKTYILFSVLIAAASTLCSQTVSFGVKGGVPLLDTTSNRDESRPYIVGPSIEIRLLAGFAIEADALYGRVGSSRSFGSLLSGANMLAPGGILFSAASIGMAAVSRQRLRASHRRIPL